VIGKSVSHYRILESLGRGGMGLVYKAEDTRLARPVALKFIAEDLSMDPTAVGRFEREAQTASALNHPNICTIYDIGKFEGQPFIAMEFLQGKTLKDLLRDGPITVDAMLEYSIQLASALSAAHTAAILHRDIKPANIFVTRQDQAKLLDFGLAKLLRDEKKANQLSANRIGVLEVSHLVPGEAETQRRQGQREDDAEEDRAQLEREERRSARPGEQ
jgi:serine/threonine protein kinase